MDATSVFCVGSDEGSEGCNTKKSSLNASIFVQLGVC